MKRAHDRSGGVTLLVGAVALLAHAAPPCRAQESSDLPPPAARAVEFSADVRPILERSCFSCHGPTRHRSDYRLDQKESALHGGTIGGAIVVGDSAQSLLIQYVAGTHAEIRMPEKGDSLTHEEVGILRAWIDHGASWPESEGEIEAARADSSVVRRKDHWAWQPLSRPTLPAVREAHWMRTPIDAFVLAKLEEHGIHLAPPAERHELLRRVCYDLIGLPPTPDEMESFLADRAPDAWERVVDRLLASPRHGERWARHWIDLVHFAETHGNDQDRERQNAWPWRDWLIASLNADQPYARLIEEQLAGDVLYPGDPQATVALGFLAAGPWDESSQLNIVDDTVDKAIARNLDRDDMLATTASTFFSTTIHCARCHDHKFDPIAQAEYYQLQSVFAGIDRANRPFDADPKLHRRRQEILRRKLELHQARPDSPLLTSDEAQREVAEWERSIGSVGDIWRVVDLESVESAGGATATKQEDGSLLFGGERAETDVYAIRAKSDLRGITAIRLEVLNDDTLPFKGPGRQDNGNLHLSELRVLVEPASDPEAAVPLSFAGASADFDQEGWTSAMAIDGDRKTAWGVWPQVGRAHHAVFELDSPIPIEGDVVLTIVLEQLHGGHHLIGRPRLSVTAALRPVRAVRLPEPIVALLSTPAEQRSDEQRAELARYRRLGQVDAELAELPPPQLVYAGTTDFAPENNFKPARGPRPVCLLARGEVTKPGRQCTPAGLQCLVGLPPQLDLADLDDEGERRAALARWISDPRNALTWRSIVNRVWHYHFGRGLVDTPSDFGAMGSRPSHPELLDWLARWFLDHGGSLKALHRLIVTSAVYMQSSRHQPEWFERDSGNSLLWRMNRSRLDAESIRDTILQAAGKLDLTMGGPSVKQFVESPGIHVTPKVDYDAFDVDSPASCRLSIYRFLFRTLPDPWMETLDCPNASQLAPVRSASVTPLQALAMLNDRFVVRMSEHLAERAASESCDPEGRIDRLFRLLLCRPATAEERARLAGFAARRGLENVARLLLNSNEFVFVE